MTWSLLNHIIADKVTELLDGAKDNYPPEVKRFYSREQAASIIHAALWGYGVREDSTAGAYAASNLFEAIGIKWWTFDDDEAALCRDGYNRALREKYAKPDPGAI